MRTFWLLLIVLLGACSDKEVDLHHEVTEVNEQVGKIVVEPAFGASADTTIKDVIDDEEYIKLVYGELFEAEDEDELFTILQQALSTFDKRVGILYLGDENPRTLVLNSYEQLINMDNLIGATVLTFYEEIEKVEQGYMIDLFTVFTTNNIELVTINKRMDEMISELALDDLSPYEKTKRLYKYVMGKMEYVDLGNLYAHSPLGFVHYGKGVCQAYAVSLSMLLDRVGIENRYIVGEIENEGIIEYHAWNMVQLDGNWYHLDPTWDDTIYSFDPYMWQYFLVSDHVMGESRKWSREHYESAPKNYGEV